MLKRIYIDNFRCLVNFELSVDSINLFLGTNGAGKTTVFEVLRKIQAFVSGDGKVDAIFKSVDCTRWQTSPIQSFELEIEGNGGMYKYELAIEHDEKGLRARVQHERLWFDNQPLLKFESGEVQLYRDNHSEGPRYPFDWSQSMLPSLLHHSIQPAVNCKEFCRQSSSNPSPYQPAIASSPVATHLQAEVYITSERKTYFRPRITTVPSCCISWTKHKAIPVTGTTNT